MELIPVESSNLKAAGYDPETRTLTVQFHRNKPDQPAAVYRYFDIPPGVYEMLMAVPSKGGYFRKEIANKRGENGQLVYRFERVPTEA